jgi:V8-like Glu-specific endopeptidase
MAVQATQLGAAGYRSQLLDLKTGYLYGGSDPAPSAPSAAAATAAAGSNPNATSLPAYCPPALQGAPLGPSGGRRLSAVFGKDDRTEVFTCAGYPFTAIGQIEFETDEGSFICSGTLVDQNR